MFNNPLAYTDPTGMMSERAWNNVWRGLGLVISIISMGATSYYMGISTQAGITAAAAGGFFAGYAATGTLKSAVIGAFSAAITAGIAGSTMNGYEQMAAQAVTGGVVESLQGGSFGHGFVAAGLTTYFMPQVGGYSAPVRTALGALIGGTISAVTGGKFANGAISGAVQGAMARSPDDIEQRDQLASRRGAGSKWTASGVRRLFEKTEAGRAFLKEFDGDPTEIVRFDRAKDTYPNADGSSEVKNLSNMLEGNYDPETQVIRINSALSNERAALALYHEYRHHLGQNEVNARIQTEQFAIDAGLGVTSPGYRTSAGTVNVDAIRKELNPGGVLSDHYRPRVRVRTYGGEKSVSF